MNLWYQLDQGLGIQELKANVEIHVHLELRFETKSELSAVMNSLIPDNIGCPEGLVVTMYDKHSCLIFDMICRKGIYVIMSTIDEILRHVIMAKQVLVDA
jgi:hypothetical protein